MTGFKIIVNLIFILCLTADAALADSSSASSDQPGDLVCDDSEVVNTCPKGCINDFCPEYEGDNGGCPKDQEQTDSCGEPVCTCRFNFKRNVTGTCIPTRECPPFDCSSRPNEEYNSCPPICPSDSCTQATPTGRCPIIGRIGIVVQCQPKCRCIKGYWRDNGICVPYSECPGICPTNERYSTCIQAECRSLNCTQKGQPVACPRVLAGSCLQGCVCTEGFLRAENGSCIPEEQCSVDTSCPTNEKYSTCIQAECKAENCSQKDQPIACPGISEGSCLQGCVCGEGFLRDEQGSCIPEDQCPADSCPTNEKYSTCIQAECKAENCSQKDQPIACPGISEGSCLQGCVCAEGFLRSEQGACIPEDQCPAPNCGKDEVLTECPNPCAPVNCTSLKEEQDRQRDCISILICLPSECRCRPGYRRDADGTCIPIEQCPNICPTNEEYSDCVETVCRGSSGNPEASSEADCSCQAGCICKEGSKRDDSGNCISENQCQGDAE